MADGNFVRASKRKDCFEPCAKKVFQAQVLNNIFATMNCKGVLVVEDDDSIRETVRQILEFEGYLVHTAENGKRALEVLQTLHYPCLILLDLMMPVMNGWQFLEARKKNSVIAALPVIVVSAVADQAENSGATEIMRKPPDIDRLLKTVASHCHAEGTPMPAATAA